MISAICDIPQQRADNEKKLFKYVGRGIGKIREFAVADTAAGGGACDDVSRRGWL